MTVARIMPVVCVCAATLISAAGEVAPPGRLFSAQQQVFNAALAAVEPVIVRIETIGGAAPGAAAGIGSADALRPGQGPTTGVICSADGYILTSSFGFLHNPLVIIVTLSDGRCFVARLIARDYPGRLTLLKIDALGLPEPEWLPTAQLRAGQWALAAGYGHASPRPALSVGVLSAVARLGGRAVQTDVKTSPANYGGPLFDVAGRVIGICVPKAGQGDDEVAGTEWYDSGIGFAVRHDYIQERLPRLKAGEDLHPGFVGLRFADECPLVGDSAADPPIAGVQITAVPDGPGRNAGLAAGDIVTQVDGRQTSSLLELRRVLARRAAGDTVELAVRRGVEQLRVSVTLVRAEDFGQGASRPDVPLEPDQPPPG